MAHFSHDSHFAQTPVVEFLMHGQMEANKSSDHTI